MKSVIEYLQRLDSQRHFTRESLDRCSIKSLLLYSHHVHKTRSQLCQQRELCFILWLVYSLSHTLHSRLNLHRRSLTLVVFDFSVTMISRHSFNHDEGKATCIKFATGDRQHFPPTRVLNRPGSVDNMSCVYPRCSKRCLSERSRKRSG